MRANLIVGGDPLLTRYVQATDPGFPVPLAETIAARSMEAPCQKCGRTVLLAPGGQTLALGIPTSVAELPIEGGSIAGARAAALAAGGAAVVCMWCALAKVPKVLTLLDQAYEEARRYFEGGRL